MKPTGSSSITTHDSQIATDDPRLSTLDSPLSSDLHPLRGPIGPRIIFFSRRSAPLTRHFRSGKFLLVLGLIIALAVGAVLHFSFREFSRSDVEPLLWISAIFGLILTDLFAGAAASNGVAAAAKRWRAQQRLSDVHLTLLRPVTIAQLIMAPTLRSIWTALAASLIAFCLALLSHRPEHAGFIPLMALIFLSAGLTAYCSAWAQVALTLGSRDNIRAFVGIFNFHAVYSLLHLPAVGMIAFPIISVGMATNGDYETIIATLVCSLPFVTAYLWAVKYLLGRAYAAKIEQVVFPNLQL